MERKKVCWKAIEPLYRAGIPNSQIARQYATDHVNSQTYKTTVTETAIRKRAKLKGWERNLADMVKAQVRENLVRDEVRGSDKKTDQEMIELVMQNPIIAVLNVTCL